tara:strand:+ start:368 stop:499 length:132 start_codon:yes stop_codon:yes gene_type:complete
LGHDFNFFLVLEAMKKYKKVGVIFMDFYGVFYIFYGFYFTKEW